MGSRVAPFLMVGLDHHTAPEELRSRASIQPDDLEGLLGLAKKEGFTECVFLSTCNRTEMYSAGRSAQAAINFLSRHTGIREEELQPHMYVKHCVCAACHLFRVAAGVESAVIGETEIVGQIKESWRVARSAGMVGPFLDLLLQRSMEAGKRVRTETSISRNVTSTGSLAIRAAQDRFGTLAERSVVLIGAGQMATRIAKELATSGARNVKVVNRNTDRAHEVASMCGGLGRGLDQLEDEVSQADVVISAVASAAPVIGTALLERIDRPMLIVDLGIPPNVEHSRVFEDVELLSLDQLTEAANEGTDARQKAIPAALAIVEQEVRRFAISLDERYAAPTIAALMRKSEQIRGENLTWAKGRLSHLDEKDLKVVEDMARRMMIGFLEAPIDGLKKEISIQDHVHIVEKLFDLDQEQRHS